ncbi:signal peptidase I [Polaribacter sejongensis]|uniref:signal peptidase I n=1 Tax=Polaribacter sejongensis TaxID=985043 RepID=UPI0035A71093
MKENWWSYKRLSGITNIKQGDIFVFNSTWSKQFILVKRCIGLPGDTLQIKNGTIYTNNNEFIEPRSVKNNYKFKAENKATLYKALDSFSNNVILKNSYNKFNLASLTASQLEHLKKQDYIDSVSIQIDTFAQKKLFVNLPSLQWGFDNMGPIIIPKKGMKIILNKETFAIYKRAINSSEGCKIEEIDGFYYIDSQKATYYTFKQDYYFMMGDNRKGTLDSRKWGFVPEENIIGKVQCVLYSNYGGEFNWSRLLKAVN